VSKCRGFVAVAGAPLVTEVERYFSSAPAPRPRGHLIAGDQDFVLGAQRSLHRALNDAGIVCAMTVVPGLAHTYPSNWPDIAAEAISGVLR